MEILHTADTHLGYRQYNSEEREGDFEQVFEEIIDEAISRDVDVVVHAGDIFHRSRPNISTLSFLGVQLLRLQQAGIPFLTIVGNHDSTRERAWPKLFEDWDLGVYLDETGHTIGNVTFYGLDYCPQNQRSGLDYHFDQSEGEVSLLVSHGLFEPFEYANWETRKILAKSPVSFDGMLLGDDHTPGVKNLEGIPLTYPGSTERTAADQRDDRGYNLITIDDSGGLSIDHKLLESNRRFKYVDLELGADGGLEYIIDRLESTAVPDQSVLIITLSGGGERVSSAKLEQVGERKGALVTQINDRREFEEWETDFESVEFADPEAVIDARKAELNLSEAAEGLELLARDRDVPKSSLKERAESEVRSLVEGDDIDKIRIAGRSGTVSEESETGDESQQTTEKASDAGTDADDEVSAVDGEAQMTLEDL